MLANVLGARDRGLDPGWPPVLVALVLLGLGVAVVSVIVVLRAFRAEARGSYEPRAPRDGRRGKGGATR
jgi:hypothetical protein